MDAEIYIDNNSFIHRLDPRVKIIIFLLTFVAILLFENPFLTISEAKEKLNCHYPKAKYNIEKLLSAGIIKEIKREKGGRLFVAEEIQEILEV